MIPRVEDASRRRCRLSRFAGGWTGLVARQESRTAKVRLERVSQNWSGREELGACGVMNEAAAVDRHRESPE